SAPAHRLLGVVRRCLERHADAAVAFEVALRLAPVVDDAPRFEAACSAALAGCGRGEGAAALSPDRRADLRRQARHWLRDGLAAWRVRLERGGPDGRAALAAALAAWQADPQLTGVRDPEALSELPEDERPRWRQLWQDVADLVQRAAPDAAAPSE